MKNARALVNRGMPVSVLKEDNIFERIISIKYDVPNNQSRYFSNNTREDIDTFYDNSSSRKTADQGGEVYGNRIFRLK